MNKLSLFDHLKACAVAARNYASGKIAELAQTTADAMVEMETLKADKQGSVSVTIPVTGWTDSGSERYPKCYEIVAESVTEADRADIMIAPGSMDTAAKCDLCPTSQTVAGKIRIWAKSVPEAAIAAEYRLNQGKES